MMQAHRRPALRTLSSMPTSLVLRPASSARPVQLSQQRRRRMNAGARAVILSTSSQHHSHTRAFSRSAVVANNDSAPGKPGAVEADAAAAAAAHQTNLHPEPNTDPASGPPGEPGELTGPNMEQAPHVSEEAAAMAKSMGRGGMKQESPDTQQGTPVGEIIEENMDEESIRKLPKVMRDAIEQKRKAGGGGGGGKRSFSTAAMSMSTRAFSTSARSLADVESSSGSGEPTLPLSMAPTTAPSSTLNPGQNMSPEEALARQQQDYYGQYYEISAAEAQEIARGLALDPLQAREHAQAQFQQSEGLKFPAPTPELVRHSGLGRKPPGRARTRTRYDGVIEQLVGLIMQDGKKARALTHVSEILAHLRTAPPPQQQSPASTTPTRSGAKASAAPSRFVPLPAPFTPSALPLHPVLYLTYAIDSVSPLVRLRTLRGAGGGGASLNVPQPLRLRQRRRTAIKWLLEAAERRKGAPGLGFARRVADEVIAVVDGKSSAWEKRAAVHRLGIAGRSNITAAVRARGGGR